MSARKNAPVLQPVLMLGRNGLEATDGLSPFGRWAQTQGALVLNVYRLEFQEQLDRFVRPRLPPEHNPQGPYLRLHVPVLIREHHLLTKGICSDVVLYTDCDVVFFNVNAHAMMAEQSRLHDHVWSYSSESTMGDTPENTGVMLINNTALQRIYTDFLDFGIRHELDFVAYDQGWIVAFTEVRPSTARFLNTEWNWKVYWGGNENNVKIMHFHGPKPGRGAWLSCLASQDPTCLQPFSTSHLVGVDGAYYSLVYSGFSADCGYLANVTLRMYMDMLDSADYPGAPPAAPWRRAIRRGQPHRCAPGDDDDWDDDDLDDDDWGDDDWGDDE